MPDYFPQLLSWLDAFPSKQIMLLQVRLGGQQGTPACGMPIWINAVRTWEQAPCMASIRSEVQAREARFDGVWRTSCRTSCVCGLQSPSRFPCVPHRQYENMTQRDQMEDVVADVKT